MAENPLNESGATLPETTESPMDTGNPTASSDVNLRAEATRQAQRFRHLPSAVRDLKSSRTPGLWTGLAAFTAFGVGVAALVSRTRKRNRLSSRVRRAFGLS